MKDPPWGEARPRVNPNESIRACAFQRDADADARDALLATAPNRPADEKVLLSRRSHVLAAELKLAEYCFGGT